MNKSLLIFTGLSLLAAFFAGSNAMAQERTEPGAAGSRPAGKQEIRPDHIREPDPFSRISRQRRLQNAHSMREVFSQRQSRSKIQQFETMDGRPAFVLDTSNGHALFRYVHGGEVLVLLPVHTTRGDTIYKNDQGDVVLKQHRVGSATLFPQGRSRGIAAWSTGATSKLRPRRVSLNRLKSDLGKIANDLAKMLDQNLSISVIGATEETAWVYSEAARNLRASVQRMVRKAKPEPPLTDIDQISIEPAEQPGSQFEQNVLTLYVNPKLNFAGRLSSLQIEQVIWAGAASAENDTLPMSEYADEALDVDGSDLAVQPMAEAISEARPETGLQ